MALGDAMIGLAGFAGGGKRKRGGQVANVIRRFANGMPGEAMKGRIQSTGTQLIVDGVSFATKASPTDPVVEVCFTRSARTDAGKAVAGELLRALEAGVSIHAQRGPRIGPDAGDWRIAGRKGGKNTMRVPEGCVEFVMTRAMAEASEKGHERGLKSQAQALKRKATIAANEAAAFERQFGVSRAVFDEAMAIARRGISTEDAPIITAPGRGEILDI